jgi:hypothetical protein
MGNMKKLAASLLACAALLLPSCTKGVEHTGDDTGLLYGNWVLDTKTVTTPSTSGAGTDSQVSETSFVNDHFYLCLVEPQLAFGKEGTLLTFDIDDVDAGKFSYNADLGKITFEKIILLSTGFPPRIMSLLGTFDVVELTDTRLVLSKEDKVELGGLSYQQKTVYSYHKLVTGGK